MAASPRIGEGPGRAWRTGPSPRKPIAPIGSVSPTHEKKLARGNDHRSLKSLCGGGVPSSPPSPGLSVSFLYDHRSLAWHISSTCMMGGTSLHLLSVCPQRASLDCWSFQTAQAAATTGSRAAAAVVAPSMAARPAATMALRLLAREDFAHLGDGQERAYRQARNKWAAAGKKRKRHESKHAERDAKVHHDAARAQIMRLLSLIHISEPTRPY